MGEGYSLAPVVLQAKVYQLCALACKLFHLFQVLFACHVVEQVGSLHKDLRLPPLAVIQHGAQLLHLAVLCVAAQHPEHPGTAQHIQIVPRQHPPEFSVIALAPVHFHRRFSGDLVHRFGFLQAQGLVCRPDHVQGAGGNGFQHPHLVHRHGQIWLVFNVFDPGFQTASQFPGLLAVFQRFGLGQLPTQPVQLCLLAGTQVILQGIDQVGNAALLPVIAHLRHHRVVCIPVLGPDTVCQRIQPVHGILVQKCHVRQLCHFQRPQDQPGLHIFVLCRPQHHLVQLGGIVPDGPFQLVLLPALPGQLCTSF